MKYRGYNIHINSEKISIYQEVLIRELDSVQGESPAKVAEAYIDFLHDLRADRRVQADAIDRKEQAKKENYEEEYGNAS